MFKSALSDGPLELILEEEFIPAGEINPKLSFSLIFDVPGHLLFIGVVVGNIHNLLYLNYLRALIQTFKYYHPKNLQHYNYSFFGLYLVPLHSGQFSSTPISY